jgi:hypothetical protein
MAQWLSQGSEQNWKNWHTVATPTYQLDTKSAVFSTAVLQGKYPAAQGVSVFHRLIHGENFFSTFFENLSDFWTLHKVMDN